MIAMADRRAQGTIEYLVIIAVVVVIALVVVSMMVGFLNPSTAVSQNASNIGATTQSIALTESIGSVDGNGVLIIQNNSGETITMSSITLDGVPYTTNIDGVQMPAGDQKTFSLQGIAPCTGTQKSYDVSITYTSLYGLTKTESLGKRILSCEQSVVAAQPNQGGTGVPGATCGNNQIEGTDICDGTALSGQTCELQGYDLGTLSCLADCSDYNTQLCANDTATPTVNLVLPTPDYPTTQTTIDFIFSVTDSDINYCELTIDDTPYSDHNISELLTSGTEYTITYTFTESADPLWNISCTDIHNNTASSGENNGQGRTIIVTDITSNLVAHFKMNDPAQQFVVTSGSGDVGVLVVAGGGGGCSGCGGGGGGGVVYNSAYPVSAESYEVVVGAGGPINGDSSGNGKGGNSAFGTILAIGGGGGRGVDTAGGMPGGSGSGGFPNGGGMEYGGATTQPTSGASVGGANGTGYGTAGGNQDYPGSYKAGGGGGAGGVGGNGSSSNSGNGGIGREFSQFASVGGSPVGWFAGGGCGGLWNGGNPGSVGNGGGGGHDTPGTPNTGGGGGGGLGSEPNSPGIGGSGIVIIKYPTTSPIVATGGAITTSGGYKFHTFRMTDVVDSSSSANTGTSQRSTSKISSAKIDRGLTFNGTSDYVAITSITSSYQYGPGFSFAVWFKANDVTNAQRIFSHGQGTFIYMNINAGRLGGGRYDGGTMYSMTGGTTLTAGTWYHAVYARNGNNLYLYLNGTLEASTSGVGTANFSGFSSNLCLSSHVCGGYGEFFKGTMDDFRLYGKALSTGEITALYNGGYGTESEGGSLGVDLNVHYKMNDNAANSTVIDSSTGQRNGMAKTGSSEHNTNILTTSKINGALGFNDSSDYVLVPQSTSLDIGTGNFSTFFWVKTTGDNRFFTTRGGDSGIFGVGFVSSGKLYFYDGTNTFTPSSLPNSNDGAWHLVGVVRSGTNYTLWTDTASQTFSGAAFPYSGNVYIGTPYNLSTHLNGTMDDFRVYSRALSQTEIAALYNQGAGTEN